MKITLDSEGRMFDEKGRLINIEKHVELKINKKEQGATQPKIIDGQLNISSKVRQQDVDRENTIHSNLKKRLFYDSTLEKQTKSTKRHKTLNFSTHGSFLEQGDKMRKQ